MKINEMCIKPNTICIGNVPNVYKNDDRSFFAKFVKIESTASSSHMTTLIKNNREIWQQNDKNKKTSKLLAAWNRGKGCGQNAL